MFPRTPVLADLTCFGVFLVLWQAFLSTGYGQPLADVPLPMAYRAPGVARTYPQAPGRPGLNSLGRITPPLPDTPKMLAPRPVTLPRLLAQAGPLPQGPWSGGGEPSTQPLKVARSGGQPIRKNVKSRTVPATSVSFGGPANSTDSYIIAQAAALNNDPTQIFAFVRDQIAFEAYAGSLRGARGTLWSKAGNSLDKSSLLIALLGAAGVSAQYVEGTITTAQAKQLILSMFQTPSQVRGCIPATTALADPANDPALQADLANHFWVEFGTSNTPADPSFAGTVIGQTIGSPTLTFASVPAPLRHKVTFRLDVEQYQAADALFGLGVGLATTEVLNQTFETADLVGQPVTEGNLVRSSAAGSIFTETTNTYSPYLRISLDPTNPSTDQMVLGQQYQEVYTNFPLGNQIVTGIFLYMDVIDSSGNSQTFERDVLDRIGYAARASGQSVSVTAPPGNATAVTDLDMFTASVLPNLQDPAIVATYNTVLAGLQAQQTALAPQVNAINASAPSAADQAVANQADTVMRDGLVVLGRVTTSTFALNSDAQNTTLSHAAYVRSYFDAPRLLLFGTSVSTNSSDQTSSLSLALDLRNDDIQIVAPPGQSANATFSFRVMRGLVDTSLEDLLMAQMTQSGPDLNIPVGASTILQAAANQGINVISISTANASAVSTLDISANAQARITNALSRGQNVIVPTTSVLINGVPTIGWIETDPNTGYTIGVLEDGGHQVVEAIALLVGLVVGVGAYFLFKNVFLPNLGPSGNYTGAILTGGLLLTIALLAFAALFFPFAGTLFGLGVFLAFFLLIFLSGATGGPQAIDHFHERLVNAHASGPTVDFAPPQVINLGPSTVTATPGTQPGVTASVVTDPTLVVPLGALSPTDNGPFVPLAFDVNLQNTGPVADQFTVTYPTVPAGFTLEPSLSTVSIPAGASGSVGFCLAATPPVPAEGTPESLTAKVTSATNPSVTASASGNFTVPAVEAISLTTTPSSLTGTASNPVTSVLQIQNIGNLPATVSLSSTTPSGVTLSGLTSPVSLNPGQTVSQTLTLTPVASAPLNASLATSITAAVIGASPAETAQATILLTLAAVQAVTASEAAQNAAALGRTDISTTLSGLSVAITTAVSSCSAASQQSVVDYVNNLIQEMNAPFLANFAAQLQTASAAISTATCANLGGALTQLSTILENLATVLSSPAAFPFNLTLQPNSAVAQPGATTSFLVVLQNNSTTTNTYSLSLGSLPGGVTGSLSASTVTLAPGASIPVNNANNNPIVTVTPTTGTAFQFSLNASINGVAGSTQTALGTITARNTFLAVEDVTATPGFTQSGGSVDVVTHIANVVNQNKTVQVTLVVNNSSSQQVLGPFTQTVALSVTGLLTTVDFGQIATTGLANGNYTLAVSVIDPVMNLVMPGGTGTGNLLIGSPVSATLSVMPTTLAPGNATVTSTLTVSSTTGGGGPTPFNLVGSVATASSAESVAINGNTVYTCDNNEVTVINAANPANPAVAGTAFAGAVNNAQDIYCDIQRGDLVMLADTGNSGFGSTPSFLAFDLTNPLSPSLIASTTVDKSLFSAAPYYQGNTAFFPTNVIFLSGGTITGQGGDLVSLDVTNFSAPAVLGTLEQPETQGPVYGGSFNVYGVTPYGTTLAYATSTTSEGNAPQTGTGQLLVVNTASPSAMSIVTTVNVPGTIQLFGPLVQGNTAVAIGDTGGWRNPDVSVDAYTGNIVIAVFDLTNPQSPSLVANVATTFLPSATFGRGAAVIGPNLFLYAGVMDSSNNQYLMLVDTTTPQNPTITTYLVPAAINVMKAVGTLLYAPTNSGLQIYSIPGTGAIQYTAAVQVPTTGKVIYNPSSFSIQPTITHAIGIDTLTWTNPSSSTISWKSAVTGIAPADVLPVALAGTVNFTVAAGSGSVTLAQVNINSGQILGLSPGMQTVAPGQLAPFTLTVNNPSSAAVTYNLAVTGISPAWVTLQPTVNVPAAGSVTIPLNLRSTLADLAGTYNFTVTATAGSTSGSVQGTLILQGTGTIGATTSTNALGASVLLMPTQATGGQGTPTTFTVQITNAGNVSDTYTLSATTPAGVTATFAQTSLTVPPGVSNFRQVLMQLTAAPGTAPGPINFTVTATSQTNTQVQSQATGTLNVFPTGVSVSLAPASVNPGGTFQLTVHNLGTATSTFTLALGGPASVIASLPSSSVTLGAGQSQSIPIAIGAAPFAALGSLGLVATATSNGVTGSAAGTVIIPSSQAVSAAFNPSHTVLNAPGAAQLILQIQNAGTLQDTYTATITSTSGPITASLVDITGASVQTTSPFILPGVTLGELVVNATLTGKTSGSVTVKITSQTNPAITATATGILSVGADTPVAIAGKNRNVPTGKYSSLDGGQSYDPAESQLTYAWTIASKPLGSTLTSLINATTPQPDFLPDVNGVYALQLIVSNATQASAPSTVQITAYNGSIPPDANAGQSANAWRGSPVLLNGTLSSDPNQTGTPLTYRWTVQMAPGGSTLAGAIVGNAVTVSFTPDVDGAYTVALTVSDLFGSSTDTVVITASDPPVPPNAVAGPNRRIVTGTPITVDGSASNDPSLPVAGLALTYQWSFVSGSLGNGSLQNAATPKVTFTLSLPGFYVTRLDVGNGTSTSFGETTVMAASYCDANADGLINQIDFDLMTALIGTVALPNDPLDVNGDGMITAADVSLCQGKAANPGPSVTLSMGPAYMTFSYTQGAALPPAQSLQVSSSSISLNVLLSAPNDPWIQLNPSAAATPFTSSVSINPVGLPPGTYQGTIYGVSSGAVNLVTTVVTLTVYAAPQFILTPPTLTFSYQTGQAAPAPQTLEVASSGKVVIFTSVTSGATWLQVQPSSGQTPKPVVITVSPQNMVPGTYTGTITFSSTEAPSASVTVKLIVTPAPPTVTASGVVNAASLLPGNIAPGEMLQINGAGFAAPGPAIVAPPGALPTVLGSTQVFFDEFAAPISSVQMNQVAVVVPYEIQNRPSVLMKVVYSGAASPTVNLIVVPTAPGIFTLQGGVGQMIAQNQDTTTNNSGNPAARGTPITFYATGGGQTNPAGVDGSIPGNPAPVPVAQVIVTIGGVAAQVTYAGGAPGYPAGLMQINAIIPPSIPAAVATPVVITIGTASSQQGTTIAVH